MSRMLSRKQALWLATAVLIVLAGSAFALFAVGKRQWLWQDTFHVRVGFTEIRGIEPGTRVRVLGRDAGEVETVQLPDAPGGPVIVRLRLDGEQRTRNLIRADATAQIVAEGMVGGRVVEINPGSEAAAPIENDAVIGSRTAPELSDLLGQVGKALDSVSNGSLAKLAKDDEAYQEVLKTVKQAQGAIASLKQNADAVKAMPIVRSYIHDAGKELMRPECERHRSWYHEAELFEPGRAILTSDGKSRLDELVPWLEGLKLKGSEIVVAAFAHPTTESDWAHALTQKQSESVVAYLTDHHRVQKMGWFTKRKVTALGCGSSSSPVPEVPPLSAPRLEVVVFTPPQ